MFQNRKATTIRINSENSSNTNHTSDTSYAVKLSIRTRRQASTWKSSISIIKQMS